jgi:hypothetical protein
MSGPVNRSADRHRDAQGERVRPPQGRLGQVGVPVLVIWGAETVLIVAIVVILVVR